MAVPAVTCGAKIVVAWNESGGFYNAYFSATATGSPTNWTWTILSVPIGLEAILSGSWGDFANGVAMGPTMQGPSLTGIPTNVVAGTIVVQCVATNGDGPSVPTVDKGAGQQCVVIKTELLDLPLPGNKEYNWGGAQLDEVLRKLETAAATSPPLAHQASHVGGADQIPTATTGARGLLPLLGGGTANFLRADGTWNAPPGGLDTTAIHKATAAEISAITAKTSPIAADLLLIEDSANSNNKKSVQIGNLPAATVSAKGLLPILGGGTSNFLRADGTWAAPGGGGVSVPGVSIEMLNTGPTTTRSTTSTSFVGIGVPAVSEPGEVIGTFVAPVAGIYELNMDLTAQGSANWGFYRLVIDYNGTPIYVGGDNTWRRAHYSSDARGYHFNATATLTAGIHTIKLEWKVASGTIYMQEASVSSAVYVRGTLVSGSGAGGTLVSSTLKTSAAQVISSVFPTWTDIGELSLNVDTIANEQVLIECMADINMNDKGTGGTGSPLVAVDIDGSVAWRYFETASSFYQLCASLFFTTAALTAGSHVIKVKATRQNGADPSFTVYGTPTGGYSYLKVTRFRGGLVPIRKDGVSITDTPAAFDFVGPGCQVTNVGGTATIALLGAEGVIKTEASDSSDRTGSGATPSEGSNTLGLSITTAANEVVMISLTGTFYPMAAVSTVTSWYKIDSGSWVGMISAGGNAGYPQTLSWTAYPTIAIAGSHTISFAFSNINGNSWTLGSTTIGPSAKSTCIQFRGGYVHPENVPILEYSSATVVNVKAGPGASSELRVLLNDGRRYTHTGTLTFNITTSGLGGRDTGSESNDIWYLYLVPGAVSGDLAVVGSITAPSTGPTGYSIWRYIGAVRNLTDIQKFAVSGGIVDYLVTPAAISTSTANNASPVEVDLSSLVPRTASRVFLFAFVQCGSGGGDYGDVKYYVDGQEGVAHLFSITYNGAYDVQQVRLELPLPNADKSVWEKRTLTVGTIYAYNLWVVGYEDGWLSGANSATAVTPLNVPVQTQASSPRTLLTSETGNLFTGTTTPITFNLPASAIGLSYEFVLQNDDTLTVVPNGSDTIRIGTSETAGTDQISATDNGAAIRLVCLVVGKWHATYTVGTWTVSS